VLSCMNASEVILLLLEGVKRALKSSGYSIECEPIMATEDLPSGFRNDHHEHFLKSSNSSYLSAVHYHLNIPQRYLKQFIKVNTRACKSLKIIQDFIPRNQHHRTNRNNFGITNNPVNISYNHQHSIVNIFILLPILHRHHLQAPFPWFYVKFMFCFVLQTAIRSHPQPTALLSTRRRSRLLPI